MKLRDILFIILLNAIWGWNFIAVKFTVADFSPFMSNMLRFSVALVFLFPFLRGPSKAVMKSQSWRIIRIAFLMGIVHFGLLYIGMSIAGGISAVAIAAQLNVPFATLCAIFMLGEKVGLTRVFAIALSFAGVLVMGFDPAVFEYAWALVLMTCGALAFALASIFMRELRSVPAMTIQAWVAVAGLFGSLVLTLVLEDGQLAALSNGSMAAWGGILFSAIFSTVVAHGGINYLLQKYEVNVVVPYLLLMPFFAVSASVVLLGETLTTRMIFGAACTLTGVAVITFRNRQKMRNPLVINEES